MGLAFTDAEIKQLIHEVDTDNSGQIEFDEFIKLLDKLNMDHKYQ
ncbi:MAG: EF-hand domain-containing protein [Flammeovirgaceae bacterium]